MIWTAFLTAWISGMLAYQAFSIRTDATFVVSDIDQKEYLVLQGDDQQRAANIIATVKKKLDKLVLHISKGHYNNERDTNRLLSRYSSLNIVEAPWKKNITSYTTNKGEEIALCIRSKMHDKQIHELDLILYVAIHELAHVMSSTFSTKSHNREFYKHFGFLLSIAQEIGIITKTDYFNQPEEYCGISVRERII